MLTVGQAGVLHSNINVYISLLFIGSFTLGVGLVVWHAFFGTNPIENVLLVSSIAEYNGY